MPRRNSTTEIIDGKVVFSKEVLSYFESIRTEENSAWIDKYFEYYFGRYFLAKISKKINSLVQLSDSLEALQDINSNVDDLIKIKRV